MEQQIAMVLIINYIYLVCGATHATNSEHKCSMKLLFWDEHFSLLFDCSIRVVNCMQECLATNIEQIKWKPLTSLLCEHVALFSWINILCINTSVIIIICDTSGKHYPGCLSQILHHTLYFFAHFVMVYDITTAFPCNFWYIPLE